MYTRASSRILRSSAEVGFGDLCPRRGPLHRMPALANACFKQWLWSCCQEEQVDRRMTDMFDVLASLCCRNSAGVSRGPQQHLRAVPSHHVDHAPLVLGLVLLRTDLRSPQQVLSRVLSHLLGHTPIVLGFVLRRLQQTNRLNPANQRLETGQETLVRKIASARLLRGESGHASREGT